MTSMLFEVEDDLFFFSFFWRRGNDEGSCLFSKVEEDEGRRKYNIDLWGRWKYTNYLGLPVGSRK